MSQDHLHIRLGQLAVERRLITEERLREGLDEQAREVAAGAVPTPLGRILLAKGYLSELQLTSLLASLNAGPEGDTTVTEIPSSASFEGAEKTSTVFKTQPFGKYTLLKRLGRGGMGIVFEGLDPILNRRVAIKTMIPTPNASPEDAAREEERFLREAQLAAGLSKHPHIVSVYEAGIIDGKPFLAMEFVEAVQFQEWRRNRSVSIPQQLRLLRDVALAVHHAHENGVVHRDLKPANVLVDPKDTPRITDFGLAKSRGRDLTGSITDAGVAIGTPAYMSPEQAQGLKTVDRRSDVYSLGVMLYEILTDRVPFSAETGIQMLIKIIEHPIPPPSTVVPVADHPAHDKALEAICMKALAKDPVQRYQTAQDLADDLHRWLGGDEPDAPLLRPSAAVRARRAGKLAAIMASLLVLGLAAWALFRPRPFDPGPVAVLDHADNVNSISFTRKGDLLAVGSADGTVALWNPATWKSVARLEDQVGKVEGVAFSPDGKLLAVVTEDPGDARESPGDVVLYDVAARKVRAKLQGHRAAVNALAFTPDGARLFTGDQKGELRRWDVAKGTEVLPPLHAHEYAIRGLAFPSDGRLFVTGSHDYTVKIWDTAGPSLRKTCQGHTAGVWGVAVAPDGALAASAASDNSVRLWDTGSGLEKRILRAHTDAVQAVAFSPDGRRLASASRDHTVALWDVSTGLPVHTYSGHSNSVWCVTFSPDGRLIASGGMDHTVRLWRVPP